MEQNKGSFEDAIRSGGKLTLYFYKFVLSRTVFGYV